MRRAQVTPYLLVLPALLTLLLLFVYPILWNGYLSVYDVQFTTYNQEWPFAGFDNYRALLTDVIFPRNFYKSLGVTLQFVGGSIVGQFVLDLALIREQRLQEPVFRGFRPSLYRFSR